MVNPNTLTGQATGVRRWRWSERIVHQPLLTVTLLIILLGNVLGSLIWINRNVVLVGNDASSYLTTTIEYARFFTPLSLRTLFAAFTYPEYRTPALFIAAQPFYWLFGVNMDSAQLVNVLMLAGLVWICFELGRTASGPGVGLMSALLVGLLPMVMAMARLFYTELPLATLVALTLLALVKSDGFRSRVWSLVWGASIGLGLLTKWALPIYVLLPTLWVIWKSDLIQANWESLQHFCVNGRALLIAIVVSMMATLAWCLPNRAAMQQFLLGDLLFGAWFLAAALWVYALQLPGSRASNWWAGIFTAVVLASAWYFPHINFLSELLGAEQTRGDTGATPLNLYNYLRYFSFFYEFHLGALATWIIVPTALFPWVRALWMRKPLAAASAVFWLTLLSTYLILLLLSQSSPRFLVPALPAVAVLGALSLWHYRPRARSVLGGVWVGILALQWSLFTFDGLAPIYPRSEPLWVVRDYAVQPRSYDTDLGYWIEPDVLDEVAAAQSPEVQRLGVLANSPQLHRGMFKYLIGVEQHPVEIQTLTERDSPGWFGVLSSPWMLVNEGENGDVEAPGRALIQRILAGDPLFQRLYQEVKRYALPNGETAHLYHRTEGPGRPLDLPLRLAQTKGVADAIVQAWSPHASLLYANPDLAVWVGIHDPAAERNYVLSGDDSLDTSPLDSLNDTLLVVWDHNAEHLSAWMNEHAYRTTEVGDDFASVAIYGRPLAPLGDVPVQVSWPDGALVGLRTLTTIAPGQVLPVETHFAELRPDAPKLSMRLIGRDGAVMASHDRPLTADDHFGLFVPPNTAPGDYDLAAVLYDPVTAAVLDNREGVSSPVLATIHVIQ